MTEKLMQFQPAAFHTASPPSNRERLLCALSGRPTDRVPVWLMRQAGRYLPEYQAVRRHYAFLELCKTPDAAAEVSIQPLDAIGSDAVIIFNDILLPLEQAGALVEFDDHGPVIHNPVRQAGDLRNLAIRPVEPDEPVARTIRYVRERVGEDIPILGFAGSPWTLATYWVEGRASKHFSTIGALRYADPDMLMELLERITPVVAEYLKIQILAGADAVQIFDTWGGLLTPGEFATFSAPWMKRMIELLRADRRTAGTPIIVYANGAGNYLGQLAELGADCLSVDWRVELGEVCESLQIGSGEASPKSIQGNLDPLALLAGPDAVRRAVRQFFKVFPPRPGHVFNLGHGILPQTSPEAARALVEAVKQHGTY